MKRFIAALVFCIVLAVLLVIGFTTQSTTLIILAVCGWTPAVFAAGYLLRAAGIRGLRLVTEDKNTLIRQPQKQQPRQGITTN